MATQTTPAPQRAGTATKKKAEKFAQRIMRELDGNPEALYVAQQMIGLLATQAKRDRREAD